MQVISRPFSCARGPRDLSASPRLGRRANSICSSTSRRASILEKSSRSLISSRSAPAEDLTRVRYSRCSALSSVPSASSDRPMMAFIGVRISWLMLARNSLLARLAASAASRARPACFLGALAIGDVRVGGDEPAARGRVAPDLEDGAVRAQPLEPVRQGLTGGRDALLHRSSGSPGPYSPALDVVADEVGVGGSRAARCPREARGDRRSSGSRRACAGRRRPRGGPGRCSRGWRGGRRSGRRARPRDPGAGAGRARGPSPCG